MIRKVTAGAVLVMMLFFGGAAIWVNRPPRVLPNGSAQVATFPETSRIAHVASVLQRHGIQASCESSLVAFVTVPADQVRKARVVLVLDSVIHWYRIKFT